MIEVRPLASSEVDEAVKLWDACGLTRPWNDPVADAQRALNGPASTIIGAFASGHLIGTAMTGWDGHRGGLLPGCGRQFSPLGSRSKLIRACEEWQAQYAPRQDPIDASPRKRRGRRLLQCDRL
jgi:hypothetical protein